MKPTKADQAIEFLVTLALSFCLSFFPLMCLVTAFDLAASAVLIGGAALALCLWSCAAAYSRSRFASAVILCWGAILLGMVVFLLRDQLVESAKTLYTAVTDAIAPPYGLSFAPWPPRPGRQTVTGALMAWSILAAPAAVWTLYKQQSLIPALVLDSLPLALCFVLVDTPPAFSWLLAYLAAALVLILTQSSRSRSARGGSRLALLVAVPVVVFLLVLQSFIPSEGYKRGGAGQVVLQKIVSLVSRYASVDVDALGALDIRLPVAETENLNVGPRRDGNATVLQIRPETSGPFYLRGTAFSTYTGSSWQMLPEEEYAGIPASEFGLTLQSIQRGAYGIPLNVEIHSRTIHPAIYLPYYAANPAEAGVPHLDTYVTNEEGIQEYTLTYYEDFTFFPNYSVGTVDSQAYDDFVTEHYMILPEGMQETLLEIGQSLGLEELCSPWEIAQAIRATAEYSLDTPKMPEGADFVLWFLQESDTGYCIHFASAATAMLRAYGWPARYVTGYLVETHAGEWTNVSAKSGHAWCEVYVPGSGWIPVDATPADGLMETMNPPDAAPPTQATRPPTTEPVTRPVPATTHPHLTEPTASQSHTGGHTGPGQQNQHRTSLNLHIPAGFWWTCLFAAVFILRRPLWRRVRENLMAGTDKKSYLRRWNAGKRLAGFCGAPVKLEDLALKAKYSQHEMSPADWDSMKAWELELQIAVLNLPGWRRFIVRWILIAD